MRDEKLYINDSEQYFFAIKNANVTSDRFFSDSAWANEYLIRVNCSSNSTASSWIVTLMNRKFPTICIDLRKVDRKMTIALHSSIGGLQKSKLKFTQCPTS